MPYFAKLSSFTRIKPAEYRLIAGAVTEDGISYGGEVIALEPQNAPKLAVAVEVLRRDSVPETDPVESVAQVLARAGRAMQSAVAEFKRLQAMALDDERRLKLLAAVGSGRNQLDVIYKGTNVCSRNPPGVSAPAGPRAARTSTPEPAS